MCRISNCICSRSCLSRAPSGSSISTSLGSNTSARASATRCCWPPESWPGRRWRKPSSWTMSSARPIRRSISALASLRTSSGKGEVLRHRHVREQGVVLEHDADVAPVRRHVVDRPAVENDLALGHRLEAGEHHEAGGLARARRAEQRQELAPRDVEAELLHHQGLAVVGLLDLDESDVGLAVQGGLHSTPVAGAVDLAGLLRALVRCTRRPVKPRRMRRQA